MFLSGPPGGAGARRALRGLLLAVERLHAVLRPPRPPHRPHLHLPGADEPPVQEPRPGPLTRAVQRLATIDFRNGN